MFARIGTWQGSEEELDRWIARSREQVKPTIAGDPGLKVAYWLVDRSAGKGLIVTLWESEAAMRASEQARLKRQAAMTTITGAVVTTDRYEVIDSLTMWKLTSCPTRRPASGSPRRSPSPTRRGPHPSDTADTSRRAARELSGTSGLCRSAPPFPAP